MTELKRRAKYWGWNSPQNEGKPNYWSLGVRCTPFGIVAIDCAGSYTRLIFVWQKKEYLREWKQQFTDRQITIRANRMVEGITNASK